MANLKKKYIVRKYVWATSASDALKVEKKTPVNDIWLDEDWKRNNMNDTVKQKDPVGYNKK